MPDSSLTSRVAWFERTFRFDFSARLYPEILERFRGTPARVGELIAPLSNTVLTRRDDQPWSIQENIGHLADLDELFLGRLDDFDAGLPQLRAADVTNRKTHEAGYNLRPSAEVVGGFRRLRAEAMRRLEEVALAQFERVAIHPRLKQPMRLVDMVYFQCEHDDYHVARIRELMRLFS